MNITSYYFLRGKNRIGLKNKNKKLLKSKKYNNSRNNDISSFLMSYKNINKERPKKTKNHLFVYIFNTFNNFYVICFNKKTNKVLTFISSGMINSLQRYNRKNKYTLELCGRRVALYLKLNKIRQINLIIKSYFRKKLLKSTVKGLLFYKLQIECIFDHRLKAHNGCLHRKPRRL